jgi:hypothetical protein
MIDKEGLQAPVEVRLTDPHFTLAPTKVVRVRKGGMIEEMAMNRKTRRRLGIR